MRSHGRFDRVLAVLLVGAVGCVGLPVLADPAPALMSGAIIQAGTGDPVRGATVKLAHHPDGKIYESAASDISGAYTISDLPAGTYDLAVETDGGLYPVGAPIAIAPGEKRKATFSLTALQEEPKPEEPKPEEPTPEEPPTEPKPEEPKPEEPKAEAAKTDDTGAVPWYRSWWFGTSVVVGSALILGGLLSSSDEDEPATASPSSD